MSAIPSSIPVHEAQPATDTSSVNATFMRFLPAVETHAAITFRRLRPHDRDEALAEAAAAAFQNVHDAVQQGKVERLTPSSVAHFAVLHVKDGRHVGGRRNSNRDVLSARAQRRGKFRVRSLDSLGWPKYDCMSAPEHVWRDHLLLDRRTPPPDQAAFRVDLSSFLAGQSDRTRQILGMLADGHKQTEVADQMGVTPSAICQRQRRAGREWDRFQGIESAKEEAAPDTDSATAVA